MGLGNFVPVVGKSTENRWAQALILNRKENAGKPGVFRQKTAFLLVDMAGEEAVETGKELVGKIQTLTAGERGNFGELKQQVEVVSMEALPQLKGLLLLEVGRSKLRIYGIGAVEVMLKRGERVGRLFEGKAGVGLVTEGLWHKDDRLLFGTKALLGEMTPLLVREIMEMESLELAGDELVTRVQAAEETEGVAGWIMSLEGEAEEVVTEVLDEPEEEVVEEIMAQKKRPAIFLRSNPKRKKPTLLLGVGALGILVISVFLGYQQRQKAMWEERYESVKAEVEAQLAEAETVADTNPGRAKYLTEQAKQSLESSLATFAEKPEYLEMLADKKSQVEATYKMVTGQVAVSGLPLWFDLTILREEMSGIALGNNEERVFVLDQRKGIVGAVSMEGKQAALVGGGDLLAGARLMAVEGERALLLANAGLVELSLKNKTTAVARELPGEATAGFRALEIFSGNVYVFDSVKKQILKYPGESRGLGEGQEWLDSPAALGAEVVDMAIDGDVWVLGANGELRRYRRGAEEMFSITKMAEPLSSGKALFTNRNMEVLYLLDGKNNRLAVVGKDGVFVKEYRWQSDQEVKDVVVDEGVGKAFLLGETKLFELKL